MIRQERPGRTDWRGCLQSAPTGHALWMMLVCLCWVALPRAQAELNTGAQKVEVDALRLDYNKDTGWVTASGNVVVRRGQEVLRADSVRVNMNTEDAYARGNVHLTRGDGQELHTDSLDYNFRTGEGGAVGLTGEAEPFILIEGDAKTTANNEYELHRATITTCTNEYPRCHYTVYAKRIQVVPGTSVKAWGATYYFGSIPVFYLPYWHRELKESSGLRIEPGYDSRMGFFLLNSYRYRLSPTLRGETHLDYRTERGLALGQDISWLRAGEFDGGISLYYADDESPLADGEDPLIKDVGPERYRVLVRHSQSYGINDSLLVEANYLSDTDILEDFFEDEYRRSSQPENYAVYAHRDNSYVVDVAVRPRLNEFYEHVSRLPEVSLDFNRQQIGGSRFYYEGQTAGSSLSRLWPEGSPNEDYSTIRVDTEHRVYYPTRAFRFLTLVPRIGARGTYYGDSREVVQTVTTNFVPQPSDPTDTNSPIVLVAQPVTVETSVAMGSAVRTLFELGLEVSFKAYKTWQGGVVSPLRHVVEPYADYTFVPEPSVLPANLYQFDDVDTLQDRHEVRLGVRNKFQSKRNGQAYDLLDLDVNTRFRLDPAEAEEAVGSIFVDAEVLPAEWLVLEFDAELATEDQATSAFNTRIRVTEADEWEAGLNYRFREEQAATLGIDLTLFPHRDWAYALYGRHEFQIGRTEEVGGYLQRNLDCMSIRLGARHKPGYEKADGVQADGEWRVSFQLWFTAFPEVGLHAGRYRN